MAEWNESHQSIENHYKAWRTREEDHLRWLEDSRAYWGVVLTNERGHDLTAEAIEAAKNRVAQLQTTIEWFRGHVARMPD